MIIKQIGQNSTGFCSFLFSRQSDLFVRVKGSGRVEIHPTPFVFIGRVGTTLLFPRIHPKQKHDTVFLLLLRPGRVSVANPTKTLRGLRIRRCAPPGNAEISSANQYQRDADHDKVGGWRGRRQSHPHSVVNDNK